MLCLAKKTILYKNKMPTTAKKRGVSSFLNQFKEASRCVHTQDIIDGLRTEIADLKAENERLDHKHKSLKEAVHAVYLKSL